METCCGNFRLFRLRTGLRIVTQHSRPVHCSDAGHSRRAPPWGVRDVQCGEEVGRGEKGQEQKGGLGGDWPVPVASTLWGKKKDRAQAQPSRRPGQAGARVEVGPGTRRVKVTSDR